MADYKQFSKYTFNILILFIIGIKITKGNDYLQDSSKGDSSLWSRWWNYDGISGPMFWGTSNPDWYMCSKGKNQSPIDIQPNILLFDPSLKHIVIDGDMISGTVINHGFDITVEINNTKDLQPVHISLGPLSYKYCVTHIKLRFGHSNGFGSEHSVNGQFFDGEMQITAYNSDVYHNLTHAQKAPRGVATLAVFLQVGSQRNEDFNKIINLSKLVLYQGQRARIKKLSLLSLLPSIDNYITYEGSFAQPGCHETVTWIILNKPLIVTNLQMDILRNLRQRDIAHPHAFMYNNIRPIMPLNRRTLRTNINFSKGCSMERDMQYEFNNKLRVKR